MDTDHITVMRYRESPAYAKLEARMLTSADRDFATTIVCVEEQMRGWLALLARIHDVHKQIPAYERLHALFDFFSRWRVLPFDAAAADQFGHRKKAKVRVGTRDLKTASIALSRHSLLLSANLRDFRQVPGLRVEDWLS